MKDQRQHDERTVLAAAQAYYQAYAKHREASTLRKRAEAAMKEADEAMLEERAFLEKSVQPICGSAHLPHMRVYQGNASEVVIIYWFDDRQRGRIEIREAK